MLLSSSEYLHSYLRWPNRSNILFFQYFGSWFNTCKTVDCVKKCGDISYQIKIRSNQARLQFSLWALSSMIKLIIHSQQWVDPELEISLLAPYENRTEMFWTHHSVSVSVSYWRCSINVCAGKATLGTDGTSGQVRGLLWVWVISVVMVTRHRHLFVRPRRGH